MLATHLSSRPSNRFPQHKVDDVIVSVGRLETGFVRVELVFEHETQGVGVVEEDGQVEEVAELRRRRVVTRENGG